jgi:hypothetical protein
MSDDVTACAPLVTAPERNAPKHHTHEPTVTLKTARATATATAAPHNHTNDAFRAWALLSPARDARTTTRRLAPHPNRSSASELPALPAWGARMLKLQHRAIASLRAQLLATNARADALATALAEADDALSRHTLEHSRPPHEMRVVVSPTAALPVDAQAVGAAAASISEWCEAETLSLLLDLLNWMLGEGPAYSRRAFWLEGLPRGTAMLEACGEGRELRSLRAAVWRPRLEAEEPAAAQDAAGASTPVVSSTWSGGARPEERSFSTPPALRSQLEQARDRVNFRLMRTSVAVAGDDCPQTWVEASEAMLEWLTSLKPRLPALPLSLCVDDAREGILHFPAPEGARIVCVNDTASILLVAIEGSGTTATVAPGDEILLSKTLSSDLGFSVTARVVRGRAESLCEWTHAVLVMQLVDATSQYGELCEESALVTSMPPSNAASPPLSSHDEASATPKAAAVYGEDGRPLAPSTASTREAHSETKGATPQRARDAPPMDASAAWRTQAQLVTANWSSPVMQATAAPPPAPWQIERAVRLYGRAATTWHAGARSAGSSGQPEKVQLQELRRLVEPLASAAEAMSSLSAARSQAADGAAALLERVRGEMDGMLPVERRALVGEIAKMASDTEGGLAALAVLETAAVMSIVDAAESALCSAPTGRCAPPSRVKSPRLEVVLAALREVSQTRPACSSPARAMLPLSRHPVSARAVAERLEATCEALLLAGAQPPLTKQAGALRQLPLHFQSHPSSPARAPSPTADDVDSPRHEEEAPVANTRVPRASWGWPQVLKARRGRGPACAGRRSSLIPIQLPVLKAEVRRQTLCYGSHTEELPTDTGSPCE